MVDTFYAIPETPLSPLSPLSSVNLLHIPNVVTKPILNIFSTSIPTLFGTMFPTTVHYYDSGIGDNSYVQHEINDEMRDKFLNKWLYEDCDECLRMLKVDNGRVVVLSKEKSETNDISKDSEDDLIKKSDYIRYNVLTSKKSLKILMVIIAKNNMKFYDIPHNEYIVKRAFVKYVKNKLQST